MIISFTIRRNTLCLRIRSINQLYIMSDLLEIAPSRNSIRKKGQEIRPEHERLFLLPMKEKSEGNIILYKHEEKNLCTKKLVSDMQT